MCFYYAAMFGMHYQYIVNHSNVMHGYSTNFTVAIYSFQAAMISHGMVVMECSNRLQFTLNSKRQGRRNVVSEYYDSH